LEEQKNVGRELSADERQAHSFATHEATSSGEQKNAVVETVGCLSRCLIQRNSGSRCRRARDAMNCVRWQFVFSP
jgi:hypothetical protein